MSWRAVAAFMPTRRGTASTCASRRNLPLIETGRRGRALSNRFGRDREGLAAAQRVGNDQQRQREHRRCGLSDRLAAESVRGDWRRSNQRKAGVGHSRSLRMPGTIKAAAPRKLRDAEQHTKVVGYPRLRRAATIGGGPAR